MTLSSPLSPDLEVARAVLRTEIEGLEALSEALDGVFTDVIDLVCSRKGHLILSGMGKSGHIARKMAATFASTGTPSFFIHPGEASHGDMGMITENDVVMLLSNSGETAELADIIRYTKRYGVPLIAVVRRKQSMLVDAATKAFILPPIPEASDINAPTTSTTMMLALGDALAVALAKRKGFTKEDFQSLHPAGSLGAMFTKVSDIMHQGEELPKVYEDAIMADVLIEMTRKRLGCTAVINKSGHLLGIITDGDLRRHMASDLLNQTAAQVMTKNPKHIRPTALVEEALHMMNSKAITTLFVAEENILQGIVHIHDCLRLR